MKIKVLEEVGEFKCSGTILCKYGTMDEEIREKKNTERKKGKWEVSLKVEI